MPTVPEYDNYKIMPTVQPVGATELGISPEGATIGARQIQQQGAALQEGGARLAEVQDDAIRRANQLRVDDSLNALKEKSLSLRFDPKTGFENIRGQDALQRPSGQSLTQEYGDQLKSTSSEIENGLANDAQKAAFRAHANDMLTTFRAETQQHEGKQFQDYALSVRDGTIRNRMNEIGLNYKDPAAVDQAVTSIRAAAYDQARLLGKSADWADAQARDSVSKAHAVAVQTALQNNDVTYAASYMQRNAKDMNADDILAVNGHLTKELNGQIGLTTAQTVIAQNGPRIETSESDRAFNIAIGSESAHQQFAADGTPLTSSKGAIGIAQVMPDTAKETAKNNGIEWDESKYKNDAAYNAKLGKLYFEQQLKDFNGNLPMAYAAYNAGPQRVKDALTMTVGADGTKSYSAAEGSDWLSKMPKETRDYVAKNMTAFGTGAGQFTKPTLVELQSQVREKIGPNQPERLKIALDETERQYKAIAEATKQRNDEAVASAMRGLEQNGGRFAELPLNIRAAIAPEDTTKVMDFGKKIAGGDDVTNPAVYQNLTTNPTQLKTMSDDQFYALRTELSQADFKHFTDERGKMLTGVAPNGPGDLNTEAIHRTLNDRLLSMGIDPTPKDETGDDAKRVGALRQFIDQSISAEQQNRGKKMNDVEIAQYMDGLFAKQGTQAGWFFNSTGPVLTTTVNQIPSATKDALKSAFARKGIANPSDADLLKAYFQTATMAQPKKAKPNG